MNFLKHREVNFESLHLLNKSNDLFSLTFKKFNVIILD